MTRAAFRCASRQLLRARGALSKARSDAARAVARNVRKVRAAKTKAQTIWRALSDTRRRAEPPSTTPPREPANACAVCLETATEGIELVCCRQRMHESCLVAHSFTAHAASCPFCRRAWDWPARERAWELRQQTWRRNVTPQGTPIHLAPFGDFHTRLRHETAVLDMGCMLLDGTPYDLDALSYEQDAIHSFVKKFFGGRWPMPGRTVLRIQAASGEKQAMLFSRFVNRFWDEPVLILEYGLRELEDETVALPLSAVTSAVIVNPWRGDVANVLNGSDPAADSFWILGVRGEPTSAVRVVDVQDDLVEPTLQIANVGSDEVRDVRLGRVRVLFGPVTATKPQSAEYDRLGPLVAMGSAVQITTRTRERVVRILAFEGDRFHCCELPFGDCLAIHARDVLFVTPALAAAQEAS